MAMRPQPRLFRNETKEGVIPLLEAPGKATKMQFFTAYPSKQRLLNVLCERSQSSAPLHPERDDAGCSVPLPARRRDPAC